MVNNNKPLMRIFCYIPTPRIWKSSITARFIDVNIEVRGKLIPANITKLPFVSHNYFIGEKK